MTLEHDITFNDHVVLMKGTKLIGFVTATHHRDGAHVGRAGSSLAIVLDSALSSDGREIPIHAADPAAE